VVFCEILVAISDWWLASVAEECDHRRSRSERQEVRIEGPVSAHSRIGSRSCYQTINGLDDISR
jgi:hypothetical protein